MYIDLKTGYSDNGPAWIGYVKTPKSKRTIYFNDHAFQKYIGTYSNYIDVRMVTSIGSQDVKNKRVTDIGMGTVKL